MLLNRQSAGNKKTIGVPGAHVRAGATWGPVVFDFSAYDYTYCTRFTNDFQTDTILGVDNHVM